MVRRCSSLLAPFSSPRCLVHGPGNSIGTDLRLASWAREKTHYEMPLLFVGVLQIQVQAKSAIIDESMQVLAVRNLAVHVLR